MMYVVHVESDLKKVLQLYLPGVVFYTADVTNIEWLEKHCDFKHAISLEIRCQHFIAINEQTAVL